MSMWTSMPTERPELNAWDDTFNAALGCLIAKGSLNGEDLDFYAHTAAQLADRMVIERRKRAARETR
jgi:hypothetical protein